MARCVHRWICPRGLPPASRPQKFSSRLRSTLSILSQRRSRSWMRGKGQDGVLITRNPLSARACASSPTTSAKIASIWAFTSLGWDCVPDHNCSGNRCRSSFVSLSRPIVRDCVWVDERNRCEEQRGSQVEQYNVIKDTGTPPLLGRADRFSDPISAVNLRGICCRSAAN
jgi:hypothetical protein